MVARETIRQLLALARSTTFAAERASALERARVLFNKHRVTDAHLRWELLTALGRHDEAGPEPSRPHAATTATGARTTPSWEEMNTHAYWAAWTTARQTAWTGHERDHTASTADPWDTWPDDEDLGWREPKPRRPRRAPTARRRRKRVRVHRHFSVCEQDTCKNRTLAEGALIVASLHADGDDDVQVVSIAGRRGSAHTKGGDNDCCIFGPFGTTTASSR